MACMGKMGFLCIRRLFLSLSSDNIVADKAQGKESITLVSYNVASSNSE